MKAYQKRELRSYTKAELERADGQDGRPALVAVDGKVYDVSASEVWKGGEHHRSHRAGRDLSLALRAAPHGADVLKNMELVGTIAQEPRKDVAIRCPWVVDKFLRLHPHPISVHFPIAFSIVGAAGMALFLVVQHGPFDVLPFYCLVVATLAAPGAIASGLLSWYYNHGAVWTHTYRAKITLSCVLVVLQAGALGIRLGVVGEASTASPAYWGYAVLVMAMAPTVVALGYFGGKLTFPS